MQIIIYLIIFGVFCLLPIWLQLLLFVISLFVSPGIGNLVMIVAMVIGHKIKNEY